jgi:hypothetical protein
MPPWQRTGSKKALRVVGSRDNVNFCSIRYGPHFPAFLAQPGETGERPVDVGRGEKPYKRSQADELKLIEGRPGDLLFCAGRVFFFARYADCLFAKTPQEAARAFHTVEQALRALALVPCTIVDRTLHISGAAVLCRASRQRPPARPGGPAAGAVASLGVRSWKPTSHGHLVPVSLRPSDFRLLMDEMSMHPAS